MTYYDLSMDLSCFSCRVNPAGNDYGGPSSAYCESCQPVDEAHLRGQAELGRVPAFALLLGVSVAPDASMLLVSNLYDARPL